MNGRFQGDDFLVGFYRSNEIFLDVEHVSLTEEMLNRRIEFGFSSTSGSLRRAKEEERRVSLQNYGRGVKR